VRVLLVTTGTLGDVKPLAALGVALQGRGHDVTLASHVVFGPLIELAGLRMHPIPGDPEQMFKDARWTSFALSPRRPRAHARTIHSVLGDVVGLLSDGSLETAVDGQDAVIFTGTSSLVRSTAQARSMPSLLASLSPLTRTRDFPHPVLAPGRSFGELGNLLSYPISERVLKAPFVEPLRPRVRRQLGLSMLPLLDGRRGRWPPFATLYAFSPTLVPRPGDWPEHLHVTGYWELASAQERTLPDEVQHFLDAGPPPILLTFGSMKPGFRDRLSAALRLGLARVQCRVLVQSSWLDLDGLGKERCLVTDCYLPHELLLDRVAAVVHHGGAGTTHAVLRAGRPSWVCAFVFDQLFWGHRVAAVGAGPAPRAAAALRPGDVVAAFAALQASETVANAERVGRAMRAEDGAKRAAVLAERLMT
jgi:sterol 3beta-glucosyltransferase